MDKTELIERTKSFVKKTLEGAEGGHDWFHIERVYKNALMIGQREDCNLQIVELAALLHDIADSKFNAGNEEIGPQMAKKFLQNEGLANEIVEQVVLIIQNVSFNKSLEQVDDRFESIELQVVQDADRLDALGAIGIARAFNYGGFKNRALYDPDIAPDLNMDKQTYKNSKAPTLNHFYEKLLLLKDQMNTKTGRKLATERHQFLLVYLEQFYAEWEGRK